MKLNLLDIIIALYLLTWIFKPLIYGEFTPRVTRFFAILMSICFTYLLWQHPVIINLISKYVNGANAIKITSITLTFITIFIITKLTLKLIEAVIQLIPMQLLANIFLAVLSLFAGVVFFIIIILVLQRTPFSETEQWKSSLFINQIISWDSSYQVENKLRSLNKQNKLNIQKQNNI